MTHEFLCQNYFFEKSDTTFLCQKNKNKKNDTKNTANIQEENSLIILFAAKNLTEEIYFFC